MFEGFRISTFKSIKELELKVGQFNVIIGENGAGKSNFLEALAIFSAGLSNKLDNEFLKARGIRVVNTESIFSVFSNQPSTSSSIFAVDPLGGVSVMLEYDKDIPYPTLNHNVGYAVKNKKTEEFDFFYINDGDEILNKKTSELYKGLAEKYGSIESFEKQVKELIAKTGGKNIPAPNQIMEDLLNISPYINVQNYFESYSNKKETRNQG